MPERVTLRVNGQAQEVAAEPNTPLLYVLRNDLGLKGTRFGCGAGHCGACTVLVDGNAVQSCDTPLWSAAGREITTIEGLGTAERPHALQRAFLDEQAAQCGYCINGIIMAAAALLQKTARPTDAEIAAALDRNLCRCGTPVRILRAIRRAAEAGK
jgi:nicotinate dehydrogenase subunit A